MEAEDDGERLRLLFCTQIHTRECLESRKHIVKKLTPEKMKIMQNVAKNKLRRFLKQKICRKTFFLIWTKLANCVKIRQIVIVQSQAKFHKTGGKCLHF